MTPVTRTALIWCLSTPKAPTSAEHPRMMRQTSAHEMLRFCIPDIHTRHKYYISKNTGIVPLIKGGQTLEDEIPTKGIGGGGGPAQTIPRKNFLFKFGSQCDFSYKANSIHPYLI